MADAVTAEAGAHGSEIAGGSKPFRIFLTEDEFNSHAAGIRAAAERKAKQVTPDERAKLDALEAELAGHKQRDLEAQGNYEQAKAAIQKAAEDRIAKEQATREKATQALRKHLVDAQLRALAEAKGAYNPLDVVAHLKDRIGLDDEFEVRVYDAPGGKVQDGVSLEAAVVDLLKANPHLAKATGMGSGAGAGGGKSVQSAMSGSPAVREAQAKYDEAMKAAQANPQSSALTGAVLAAKAALTQALAK
jgi:hypothetical protein